MATSETDSEVNCGGDQRAGAKQGEADIAERIASSGQRVPNERIVDKCLRYTPKRFFTR